MFILNWGEAEIDVAKITRYNRFMAKYHSPLYPFDDDISGLDASIREAELFDDTMQLQKDWEEKHNLW